MTDELRNAIQYRRWVRMALSLDDMALVAKLNREADKAYLRLDVEDQLVYLDWAVDR